MIKGAVHATRSGESARLLDRNAPVYETDTISTASKSFAVIKMADGTRISLRPDSELAIEEYDYPAAEEKATYNLAKGGLRALTGLIGKKNSNGNILKTRVGTMGIRGTEFDARLCSDDCGDEETKLEAEKGAQPDENTVIGRVLLAKGDNVTAQKKADPSPRKLTRGGPLYQGDTLTTGDKSFLTVAFRDNSRLSVRANSQVALTEYTFDLEQPAKSKQSTQLLTGGLRALTGLIGKRNPDSVRVKSPQGVMGIRGTGFDMLHENPVYLHVWEGEVIFCDQPGSPETGGNLEQDCPGEARLLGEGQALVARGPGALETLNSVPERLKWSDEDRPDRMDVDIEALFGTNTHDYNKPGLLLTVYDGHVALYAPFELPPGTDLRQFLQGLPGTDIGAGESLFSNGEEIYRLDRLPLIQLFDDVVRPGDANDTFLDTLGLFPGDIGNSGELCTIQ